MGCHFLLQGIFQAQGLNLCLLLGRQILFYQATWEDHEMELIFLHLKTHCPIRWTLPTGGYLNLNYYFKIKFNSSVSLSYISGVQRPLVASGYHIGQRRFRSFHHCKKSCWTLTAKRSALSGFPRERTCCLRGMQKRSGGHY